MLTSSQFAKHPPIFIRPSSDPHTHPTTMAPPAELTIGLLGTGKIGSAVVTGFCSEGGWQPQHVTVSARTKAKADALVAKFPTRVRIGATNQETIDQSDVIFIGLLPNVAKEELPTLTFAPHKRVVSMMATIPYDELVALVRLPRENVVRTVPLTSASKRSGPILAFPVNEFARDLLTQIGTPVMVASEAEITTLVRIHPLVGVLEEWVTQHCLVIVCCRLV
jgi:pyrroline-5-carboxylate reductase